MEITSSLSDVEEVLHRTQMHAKLALDRVCQGRKRAGSVVYRRSETEDLPEMGEGRIDFQSSMYTVNKGSIMALNF